MIATRKTRTEIEQANFDTIDAEVEWIARELGARGMHFWKSTSSASRVIALRVSMPRKHRSQPTGSR